MPIDQLAFRYLDTYTAGRDFPSGLSFRTALAQAQLDFSRDSLARVDGLLGRVREQFGPERAFFPGDHANRTFLLLLAFYVGTVVSHCSGRDIHWYGYDEMRHALPRGEALMPRCFAASITCILGGGALFAPLAVIEETLFGPQVGAGVAGRAAQLIAAGGAPLRYGQAG